ncbi:MAG: Omp28-related outer membrane protein [Alistipes sp.]|nr:Omp28-related outer membrane protein [Alistipes sp.]
MKLTKFFAMFAGIAMAFAACEPVDDGKTPDGPGPDGPGDTTTTGDLTLSADKTAIELGGTVTFTVTQKDETTGEEVDVTKDVTLYDADLNKLSNPLTPTTSGSINVTATKGKYTSNTVTITVMAQMPEVPADPQPENLAFNHRTVLIDHTGVNCGWCPSATDNLLQLAKTEWHSHYNEVTCHAGAYATGDPANSAAANALNQFQGPRGYPSIMINFYNKTESYGYNDIISVLNQVVKKEGADAGISMAVAGDNSNIYCAAQVKANVAQEYKVVAWLLESGIYSPNQSNATQNHHKIYNYALRNISGEYSKTNVAGESIGVLESGKTYDCAFELPIVSTKWNWENMGVLVIVSAKDANNRWEVVNSAYCSLEDKSKAYEYVE